MFSRFFLPCCASYPLPPLPVFCRIRSHTFIPSFWSLLFFFLTRIFFLPRLNSNMRFFGFFPLSSDFLNPFFAPFFTLPVLQCFLSPKGAPSASLQVFNKVFELTLSSFFFFSPSSLAGGSVFWPQVLTSRPPNVFRMNLLALPIPFSQFVIVFTPLSSDPPPPDVLYVKTFFYIWPLFPPRERPLYECDEKAVPSSVS